MFGIAAQLERLKTGTASISTLESLQRTDAILTVLRSSSKPLRAPQILNEFEAAGRSDDLPSIRATLKYLLERDLVTRPGRGVYIAR